MKLNRNTEVESLHVSPPDAKPVLPAVLPFVNEVVCIDWERDDISSPLIRKIHPTQKPVKLIEKLIELFTDEGDVVIDPCAGSGSTLIAAANKKRKGFGFEIKKEFYTQAKDWEEEILNYNKEIEEFGFGKTLMEKSSLTLWS